MMKNTPLISVIMSVYNGEKYLQESIESILKQTYKNIEFIIINDGSTDKGLEIIKKYQEIDNRIILENNIINKGLIYSLNRGVELSQGKYIARMDADDISLPTRLEKQLEFMEKNLEISVLGTGRILFKSNLKFITKKIKPIKNTKELKINSLFETSLAHPTVMIRKKDLENSKLRYEEEDKGMEDFGLWLGLSKNYKFAVLPDLLLKYRFLQTSITSKSLKNIEETRNIHQKLLLKKLRTTYFPNLTDDEARIHAELCGVSNYYKISKSTFYEKKKWLKKLYNENKKNNWFDEKLLLKKLHELYLKNNLICGTYEIYEKFDFFQDYKVNYIMFLIKKYKIKLSFLLKKILR